MIRKMPFLTTAFVLSLLVSPLSAQQEVEGEVIRNGDSEVATDSSESGLEFLEMGTAPATVSQLKTMERHVAELAEKCKPAIVNIQVNGAQGSGVVVDRYGTILTAAHVIMEPGLDANVTFPDGTEVRAKTLGINRRLDSGMLKISEKGRYPYLNTGESELLKLGQWVLAIGHPGGIDKERGLVVRVGRVLFSDESVLRTDCTLVGGDSGGPLIDMDGYVIGIHSRIGGSLTDNLHVPMDGFSKEWDELLEGKRIGEKPRVKRAYLGFRLDGDTNKVESITEDGPAEKAGIKAGDLILEMGGKEVDDRDSVFKQYKKLKPGKKIIIVVERDDEEKSFDLEVGER